jgi:hypothetical protein
MKKIIAAALLAFLPALALAQTAARPGDDCAAQRRRNPNAVCTLSMGGGEDVTGEVVAPTGEFKTLRARTEMTPLIRERLSFVDKIFKSANDI